MANLKDIISSVQENRDTSLEIEMELDMLMMIAESKASIMQNEIEYDLKIREPIEDLIVPISEVLQSKIEYKAIVSDSSELLGEFIQSISNMMGQGKNAAVIVNGIANIANSSLLNVIENGEGNERVKKFYVVAADYPNIVRFDFALWVREVKSPKMRKYLLNAVSCVMYKSAVDISRLEFNDFSTMYRQVLNAGVGKNASKINELIAEANEIYRKYKGND